MQDSILKFLSRIFFYDQYANLESPRCQNCAECTATTAACPFLWQFDIFPIWNLTKLHKIARQTQLVILFQEYKELVFWVIFWTATSTISTCCMTNKLYTNVNEIEWTSIFRILELFSTMIWTERDEKAFEDLLSPLEYESIFFQSTVGRVTWKCEEISDQKLLNFNICEAMVQLHGVP